MFNLVEAVAVTQCLRFGFTQAIGVGAELVDQRRAFGVGRSHQGLRQGRRHFTADRGVGQAVEQCQTTKVPSNVASA